MNSQPGNTTLPDTSRQAFHGDASGCSVLQIENEIEIEIVNHRVSPKREHVEHYKHHI